MPKWYTSQVRVSQEDAARWRHQGRQKASPVDHWWSVTRKKMEVQPYLFKPITIIVFLFFVVMKAAITTTYTMLSVVPSRLCTMALNANSFFHEKHQQKQQINKPN